MLGDPLPGTPVPVTGQTFAVLLMGAALGWRRALPSMLLHLVAGAAGVPVVRRGQQRHGGPSLGYVIGFVLVGAGRSSLDHVLSRRSRRVGASAPGGADGPVTPARR